MSEEEKKEVEMFVVGLVLDPATNAPIVILKDASGGICLPIWIGLAEATAIASALKKIQVARPMTHDLLKNAIDELSGRVLRVFIHDLRENTFLAAVELVVGDTMHVIDSRPSDAIALAVRVPAPIFVAKHVLSQAQVALVAVNQITEEAEEGLAGTEIVPEGAEGDQDFSGIDRDKWAEILAEMDPTDFKYKM